MLEARQKITSMSYCIEFRSQSQTKDGNRTNQGYGLVESKGNCYWSTYENDARILEKDWHQAQSARIALNERYLAYWPTVGNAYAYRAEHPSIEDMSRENLMHLQTLAPPFSDLLNIAFEGFESSTFSKQMKMHPDKIRWIAEKVGDLSYEIRRYSPYMHDQSKPDTIWKIGEDKGYLVTERVAFTKDGNISDNVKIKCIEPSPGIWFPVAANEERYSYPKNENRIVDSRCKITLKDIQLNVPIPEEHFTMQALDLPNDITIFWTDTNNKTDAWVYDGGKLVRRSVVFARKLEEKRKKQRTIQQSLHGVKAPPLSVETWMQGKPTSLDELRGRYVLLHFFGYWCVPCKKTYPLIVKQANSTRSEDLIVIGIHTPGSKPEDIQSLLKRYDIKYSIAIDKSIEGSEYMGKTFSKYLVKTIPHAVLIDRTGQIASIGRVEEVIDALVNSLSQKND